MKIKEMERFNNSYHDSYYAIYCLVGYEAEQLYKQYHSTAIDDIKSYQSKILHKVVHTTFTLFKIITDLHDYNSAGTILRMIADNMTSYHIIYHEEDEEIRILRHFLFIIDGLNTRLKSLREHNLYYDGKISRKDYDELYSNVVNAISDSEEGIKLCINQIKNLSLYTNNQICIDNYIKKKNWQFISIDNPRGRYKWEDMYKLFDSNRSMAELFVFLSQFVHGLSVSNLVVDESIDKTFEPYYSFGISLLGTAQQYIENDFGLTRDELLDGFQYSDFFHDFILCLSDDKVEEALKIIDAIET